MTDGIEKIIGYIFNDKQLLVRAFTHSSYAYENGTESNEQFEFLGDGLLGFVVAEKLLSCGLPEGDMTVKRAAIVSSPPLCRVMEGSGLAQLIKFGQGETGKDHTGKKVHADAFEALVGAVYLDGGLDNARQVIFRLLGDEVDAALSGGGRENNYKGDLQEYVQKHKLGDIEYVQLGCSGDDHAPEFKAGVKLDGRIIGEGRGKKLKDAEQQAAKAAMVKISV